MSTDKIKYVVDYETYWIPKELDEEAAELVAEFPGWMGEKEEDFKRIYKEYKWQ